MYRKYILHWLILLLCIATVCNAQREERSERSNNSKIIFETHNFHSTQPSKSRLDILYRVPYDFFIFIKNPDAVSPPFVAHGEITVDLIDKNKSIASHAFFHKTLEANDPSPSFSTKSFLEGMTSCDLPPGEYTLQIEITDHESGRVYRNEPQSVRLRDFSKEQFQLGDILLLNPRPVNTDTILPFNDGGDVPFARHFEIYSELITPVPRESIRVDCKLFSVVHERDSLILVLHDSLIGVPTSEKNIIQLGTNESEKYYILSKASTDSLAGLWFTVQNDTLTEGSYRIELTATARNQTVHTGQSFRIRWFDKPFSLQSIPNAIDALSYIADKDEIDNMRHADEKTQKILFDAFWKKRDPTPNTAFNEVMNEYYRRVDYATNAFSTIQQRNGMKTDRGKTYIFYGPPESTSRELSPSSFPTETWVYSRLHKKLIFTDKSKRGDYQLTATEDR